MFAISSQFSSTFYHPRTDHWGSCAAVAMFVCLVLFLWPCRGVATDLAMVGLGTAGIEKAPDLEKCCKQFTGDLASGDEGGVIFLFMFAVFFCSFQVLGIHHPGGDSDGLSDIGYCVDLPVPGRNNVWPCIFKQETIFATQWFCWMCWSHRWLSRLDTKESSDGARGYFEIWYWPRRVLSDVQGWVFSVFHGLARGLLSMKQSRFVCRSNGCSFGLFCRPIAKS